MSTIEEESFQQFDAGKATQQLDVLCVQCHMMTLCVCVCVRQCDQEAISPSPRLWDLSSLLINILPAPPQIDRDIMELVDSIDL